MRKGEVKWPPKIGEAPGGTDQSRPELPNAGT